MLKKLTFLFLALAICLPLVLASCGDELTDEEIASANFQEADTALTLSMWLPVSVEYTVDTDNDGIFDQFDDKFIKRLSAVESAINDYLRSNAYCTELDLVVVNEKDYYNQLTDKFSDIKEIEKTNGKAYLVANKYVNKAEKNPVTGIYQMAYPDVLEQQLDIFFVGGYDNYIKYIEDGDTYALNDFFSVGQVYNGLFKMIRQSFFEITMVDSNYYGIPNNHVYAEKGQYVLVDKELYNLYSNSSWDVSYSLYDLESYIELVGLSGLDNVIPFYAQPTDVPGIVYVDKEYKIVASLADPTLTPVSLIETKEYSEYSMFYQRLIEKSFAYNSVGGKKAAVQIFNGNLSDIENKEDYYIIETVPPYANLETAFSSMFAISTHSANYERAMRILYLLQENVQVRTLLQYGVEEVDYDIGYVNGETVIYSKDSGYEMNLLYTGNCYRTYPDYGVPMSYWDDVKELNLVTGIHPFYDIGFKVTDELKNSINGYVSNMSGYWDTYWSQYMMYLNEELKAEIESIVDEVSKANNSLRSATNSYNRNKDSYDASTTDEDRQWYAEKMAEDQAKIDEFNAKLAVLNEQLAPHLSFLDAESIVKENLISIAALYSGLLLK